MSRMDRKEAAERIQEVMVIIRTQHMCKDIDGECTEEDRKAYIQRFEACKIAIAALQEPERKKGRWEPFFEDVEIFNTGGFTKREQTGWVCSRCKAFSSYCANYCSDCGADMRGEEE